MAKRLEKKTSLYLQIVNGKLGMYVENPTQFSEPVTSAEGKTRNYEFFESLTGTMDQIYVYDKELTNDKSFEMLAIKVNNSNNENEILTVPFKSRYAQSFIMRLENIDLKNKIEIKSFKILDKEKTEKEGKKIYSELLLPYQNNKSVENPYKLNGTKKLPQPNVLTKVVKGVTIQSFDFSNVEEFFREIVKNTNEQIKELKKPTETVKIDIDLSVDDLPF